ncbi:TPA: hypothetical protein NIC60_000677 [Pseudomonas aeruginosa]|nr:hypothetical protein [Pseudomonas aeruginosa]
MSNELTDVRCPCGAEFQADSYDAGFIAGSGMCQNCDAALPPKDICTCPSGDGSLVHPCPAHPAPAEQAGGDERAAFEEIMMNNGRDISTADGEYLDPLVERDWQARAALAQPSPAQVECIDCHGSGFCMSISNEEIRCPCRAPIKFSDLAQAEQAEAERPEVVAVMESNGAGGKRLAQRFPIVNVFVGDELMTVAQHERITAQLHDALDESDGDRWKLRSERDAANARLHEVATACATAEQQRDAALARVAELDKQCRDDVARALGLRPSQERGFAWSYLLASIKSCVKASEDAAQAQHSVPEGYALIPTRETEAMHDAVMALLYKGVARTDTQKLLDAYIAAAPGKEVGHE